MIGGHWSRGSRHYQSRSLVIKDWALEVRLLVSINKESLPHSYKGISE